MAKIKDLTLTSPTVSKYPLVIGYFSCVHVMHEQLLNKFHHFNVLTFKDFSKKSKNAIYPFSKRIANIEKYKPINIYLYDLNSHNCKAHEFIENVLLKIKPTEIVVGSDFKFGSDRKGVDLLRHYFKVITLTYNKHVSTTKIVDLINKNKIDQANDYLVEPYYYSSAWISGRKLGRRLGYRTINLKVTSPIFLKDGVYITKTQIGNKQYKSMSFIGKSATTFSNVKTLESHILDAKIKPRWLYPSYIRKEVKISFLKFLRVNKKFGSKEKLQEQLAKDKKAAIKYFKENI